MTPNTDNAVLAYQDEIPATLSIRIKEIFFMLMVVIMGFSGITLCIDKVYPKEEKIFEDIIIHDSDVAQVNL